MKANISLRALITDQAGTTFHIPATVELEEWFEFCDIDDELDVDIDLHAALQENHQIAHIWNVADVKSVRPHLSDEDAWEVLQAVESQLDSEHGITWTTIRDAADDLFPAQRKERSAKMAQLIADYDPHGDERENLVDLLADSMHWCEGFGEPFDEFCDSARMHFDAERKSAKKED